MKSKFGKGCTYCLGLFLAHEHRFVDVKQGILSNLMASTWFNAASDHLYELQIPSHFPKELKDELKEFQLDMLNKGHGSGLMSNKIIWDDVEEALSKARLLLRKIDRCLGVQVVKGAWE